MTTVDAAPKDRHLFFAFSTYTGEKAAFETWYDQEHIPQVLSAPGMVGAQRFEIAATKPLPGVKALDFGHLAVYEIEGDPSGFRTEVKRQLLSGEMAIPEFMNQPFKTLILKPVSRPFVSPQFDYETDWHNRHLFFAWSRYSSDYPTFAKWYDDEHIPQVMSAPGVARAQRFQPADVKPLPGVETPDLGHLAMYELDGDAEGFRAEVKRQLMSGEMVLPDFMIQPFSAMFMAPVSPFFTARVGAVS